VGSEQGGGDGGEISDAHQVPPGNR
jgi:hypothetical protein